MTGYPPELLDLDLDLEADLGVDTVKQAEVFAAVRERFGVERDDDLALREFPTLAHVIGWVRDKTGTPARSPAPATARSRWPSRTGLHPTTVAGDLDAVDRHAAAGARAGAASGAGAVPAHRGHPGRGTPGWS